VVTICGLPSAVSKYELVPLPPDYYD